MIGRGYALSDQKAGRGGYSGERHVLSLFQSLSINVKISQVHLGGANNMHTLSLEVAQTEKIQIN